MRRRCVWSDEVCGGCGSSIEICVALCPGNRVAALALCPNNRVAAGSLVGCHCSVVPTSAVGSH